MSWSVTVDKCENGRLNERPFPGNRSVTDVGVSEVFEQRNFAYGRARSALLVLQADLLQGDEIVRQSGLAFVHRGVRSLEKRKNEARASHDSISTCDTSPSLSSLVYVSIRPNPISESDWRLLVRVSGPSKMGLLVDCFARNDSGIRRSAGSDRRLLMSCCECPWEKERVVTVEAFTYFTGTYFAEAPIFLAHLDRWRDVRIGGQRHFLWLAIRAYSWVLVQNSCPTKAMAYYEPHSGDLVNGRQRQRGNLSTATKKSTEVGPHATAHPWQHRLILLFRAAVCRHHYFRFVFGFRSFIRQSDFKRERGERGKRQRTERGRRPLRRDAASGKKALSATGADVRKSH